MKKEIKNKQERGITLIALVVTIVVLLILAGVSLNLVFNNNGIITKGAYILNLDFYLEYRKKIKKKRKMCK